MAAAQVAADSCGSLTFQAPARYAVTADNVVFLADADRDGRPDIITSGNQVDQLNAFSILPNLGNGVFGSERPIPSRLGERLEDAADLNGDGNIDLVVAGYWQNGIAVYRGSGLLQFGSAMSMDTATHGGPSRVVDYDGDGRHDIVSFSFGSGNPVRVHLFRGRGDGELDPKQTFETGRAVADSPSVRVREGIVEILANERSGHLVLFRISAASVSSTILDAGPGTDLNSLFVDLNGDGIADIVDTNDGGSAASSDPSEWIFVRLAKPDGGFEERRQIPHPRRMTFPTELRAGDLDGDGRMDLVAGDFHASTLYYFRGHGNGNFDAALPIDVTGPVNDVAIADLNGDHRPDLVTANNDHSVSVILNGGSDCVRTRRRAVRH